MVQQLDKYRAITLLGPRQSGKTTLAKMAFADFNYQSLEDPDIRQRALTDPRGFLKNLKGNSILDEIQRTPELLSYLQGILDDASDKRHFVLTGSNSLFIADKIAQSLAGRTRLLTILALKRDEIPTKLQKKNLDETMYAGSYPRIFDKKLNPTEWLADYYQTYIEKDVRQLLNIENLTRFDRFVRVLASRAGQLINFASIASDVGITQPTAKAWAGVLEASFVIFFLQPHFRNFSKRIIKAPKLYFYDSGLLSYLLRIQSPEVLNVHPLRGHIFENWVITEIMKDYFCKGKEAPLSFWRDQHGHEVDLVTDLGSNLELTEIKSSETFHPDFVTHLDWLNKLQKKSGGAVVYGGNKNFTYQDHKVVSWLSL
jgi:hypothetical protein